MARERLQTIEFGNLVCRFGGYVLVDKLREIVEPAFLNDHERTYGDSSFFFYDVKKVMLADGGGVQYSGIAGRLVKNTKLRRDQVWKNDGLVKDKKSLASSPSSFFLLVLDTHRLMYVRETSDAPNMSVFRTTLHTFLKREHDAHVSKLAADLDISKAKVVEDLPRPSLQLIPMTSDEGIDAFIASFEKLTTFEVSIRRKNDEIDDDEFFEELDQQAQDVGAKNSVLRHQNSQGLDVGSVTEKLKAASGTGHQMVKLKGLDFDGDILQGNNESFQLKRPTAVLPNDVKMSAKRLFDNYSRLAQEGLIKVPPVEERVKNILRGRNG